MKAAVLREFKQPLCLENVSISKPKGRAVLVKLDEINGAIQKLRDGKVARGVIDFDQ